MQSKRTDRSSSFPASINPQPVNSKPVNPRPVHPVTGNQPLPFNPLSLAVAAPVPRKGLQAASTNSRLTACVLTEFVQQGLKDVDIAELTGYSAGYIKNCRHAFGIFHTLPKIPEGATTAARPVRLCSEHSVWGRVAGATPAKCLAGMRYTDDPRAQAPEGLWRVPRPETNVYAVSSAAWAVTASPEEEEFLADMAPPPVSPRKPKR